MAKRIYPNKSGKRTRKNNSPFDRALKYLSFRPRTEKEIRDYLGEECTEDIIGRLKELNFINDEEFAKWYIDQRTRFRPRSHRLMDLELKKKGIILDTQHLSPNTNEELAKKALEKKLILWDKLPYLEYKTKAVRFLASRGFSWDTIEKIVKKGYNGEDVN
jgi:regulatory protein